MGINTANYYGTEMMKQAGLQVGDLDENSSAIVLYIIIAFINFVFNVVAVLMIDRLGRRYVILRTTPLAALGWFIAAIGISLTGENQSEATA